MPELRCKPGQMAMIVQASRMEPCSLLRVGVPVTVAHLVQPSTLGEHFREGAEGPVWLLAEPLRCPHGRSYCPGIDRYPDACLRPFDPESVPDGLAFDMGDSRAARLKCVGNGVVPLQAALAFVLLARRINNPDRR